MGKKSGKAGKAVLPTDPDAAEDADVAEHGEYSGDAHKEPEDEETAEEKDETSWIEIELLDEDDEPVPGEKYRIKLPDKSVADGTLDDNGFARVQGFKKGTCKVSFPLLDKDAWEHI